MATKRQSSRSRLEVEFLAQYDASRFPRPSVAVDIVLLTVHEGKLKTVVVRRDEHPDLGCWALPGGFLAMDETLEDCAQRKLEEKTGLKRFFLEQLYTFGDLSRDPRTRVISVGYYALVPWERLRKEVMPGAVLAEVKTPWKGEKGGPVSLDLDGENLPLAFDHDEILGVAIQRLRGKLGYAPIGFELLPREFTLRQLQGIHETILDRRLNKDSFRRTILASGLVAATGKREQDVSHRPAELYRFSRKPARR